MIKIICLFIYSIIFSQEKEDFNNFIIRFSEDSEYQIKRIKFPLIQHFTNQETMGEDSTIYTKKTWEHHKLFEQSYIMNFYNNHYGIEADTDERLLQFSGIENGILIGYYFKRILGKWYLVRYEDFST